MSIMIIFISVILFPSYDNLPQGKDKYQALLVKENTNYRANECSLVGQMAGRPSSLGIFSIMLMR